MTEERSMSKSRQRAPGSEHDEKLERDCLIRNDCLIRKPNERRSETRAHAMLA